MPEQNPYSAPNANLTGVDSFSNECSVTQGVVEQLARTKGWTRLFGVLSMLVGALFLFTMIAGGAMLRRFDSGPRVFVGLALVFYLLAGATYVIVGLKLSGFSSAVTRLIYTGKERDLEDALDRQRSFWVLSGVLGIIVCVVMVIVLIASATKLQ